MTEKTPEPVIYTDSQTKYSELASVTARRRSCGGPQSSDRLIAKELQEEKLTEKPKETGGPSGLEPTRYGDWERNGKCVDF